ncbi:MAG: hypothetical protein RR646_04340 [Erysipelotrichaceae bacterium]
MNTQDFANEYFYYQGDEIIVANNSQENIQLVYYGFRRKLAIMYVLEDFCERTEIERFEVETAYDLNEAMNLCKNYKKEKINKTDLIEKMKLDLDELSCSNLINDDRFYKEVEHYLKEVHHQNVSKEFIKEFSDQIRFDDHYKVAKNFMNIMWPGY